MVASAFTMLASVPTGEKNRRTRTTPTSLGKSTLLVTSTTVTTAESTVPTGICSTDYSKIYHFLWLRSPGTKNYEYDACCVALNGGVYDTVNIGVSYGRKDRRSRTSTTVRI